MIVHQSVKLNSNMVVILKKNSLKYTGADGKTAHATSVSQISHVIMCFI